jgi:hypothetical protein
MFLFLAQRFQTNSLKKLCELFFSHIFKVISCKLMHNEQNKKLMNK